MICGPALTAACSIRKTTVGFVVGSDVTEDTRFLYRKHEACRESRCNSKALHGDER